MSYTSPLSPAEKAAKAEKLNNAQWLNESLATDIPAFEKFCEEILEDIYKANKTQRKNINKHLPQLRILIPNLIVALEFHRGVIAISRTKETYSPLTKLSYRGFFGGLVGRRSRFEVLSHLRTDYSNVILKKPQFIILNQAS